MSMYKRKISWRFIPFATLSVSFLFLLVPISTNAAITTVKGEFLTQYGANVSTDDVVGAATPNGAAVVAVPLDDGSGVELYLRAPERNGASGQIFGGGTWLTSQTLTNDAVDEATSFVIRDVQVSAGEIDKSAAPEDDYIFIGWVTTYYDSYNDPLREQLHLYAVAIEGDSTTPVPIAFHDDVDDGDSCVGCATGDFGYLQYQLDGSGTSATIITMPSSDTGFYRERWDAQKGWAENDTDFVDFSVSDSNEDFTLLAVSGGNGAFNVYIYDGDSYVASGLFAGTFLAFASSNDEDYVLYETNNKIILATYASNTLEPLETVFDSVPNTVSGSLIWNDYGAGQIAVALKSEANNEEQLHFALKRSSGWVKAEGIFQRKEQVGEALVQVLANGKVNMLWKHKSKIWVSSYAPGADQWTTPVKKEKRYVGRKWYKPYSSGVTYAVDNNKTMEWFRSKSNKYYVLRKWNVAQGLTGSPIVRLKKNFVPFHYAKHGDYYMILMNKNNKLRAVVRDDTNLF